MDCWEGMTPTVDEIKEKKLTPVHYSLWSSIRNGHVPEQEAISLKSRFTLTTYGANAFLEDGDDTSRAVLETRCVIELAVMQIAHWLRLPESSWNETNESPSLLKEIREKHFLSAPDTGGRVLQTCSTATPDQTGHMDYAFRDDTELDRTTNQVARPPYFAIVTGREGAPLWIAEGSHRFLPLRKSGWREVGKDIPMRLVRFRPNSLILFRGDLIHAGCGGKATRGKRCPRFHMYLMRHGVAFRDSINCDVGRQLKPRLEDLDLRDEDVTVTF